MSSNMDPPSSRPNRPKSRQSIAHVTSLKDATYDKENATADLSAMQNRKPALSDADRKKLRSKSLGPGGLEALKESAGNATKTTSPLKIKSILKPTVPLTPPQVIPSFDETRKRKRSPGRSARKTPKTDIGEELLIDFSTPATTQAVTTITGAEALQDPFSPIKRTNDPHGPTTGLRMEGEQPAGTRDSKAEELKRAQKHAIEEQRAARRKSMKDRRVSFAPEATLHTWNVVEMVEDSTTSSESNSTKRQSSIIAAPTSLVPKQNVMPESEPSDPPSTPPEQTVEPLGKASPAHQRDLHQQRRRRRSPGVPTAPSEHTDRDDSSPASTYSGSSAVGDSSPILIEDSIHSSSDGDGDTAMSMDDATGQTVQSEVSSSSTASSLDERLRRAAAEAGTRGIAYDENGDDLSMELADGTITSAFQPWVGNHAQVSAHDVAAKDRKTVGIPFPASQPEAPETEAGVLEIAGDESSEDLSMELADGTITTAFQPWVNGDLQAEVQGNNAVEDVEDIKKTENRDDVTMELADGTITTAFQPWVNGQPQQPKRKLNTVQEEENEEDDGESDDLPMDIAQNTVTKAFQSWVNVQPQMPEQKLEAVQEEENFKFDEAIDDLPMDIAENTVTKAFQSWVHRDPPAPGRDSIAKHDQENVKPSPIAATSKGAREKFDHVVKAVDVPNLHRNQAQEPEKSDIAIQDEHIVNPISPAARSEADAVEADNVFQAVDFPVMSDKQEPEVKKVSLQEFLNMTNIHFMELSATKRRHTLAPVAASRPSQEGSSTSIGACFAAAATTLHLLDLYQHATRELKSYMSTGRKVIRSIEQETLEEQPALFREYVDARSDVRTVMDNQFRNGKANARLQSKEGWYAWRRQLVEGLRGGLDGIRAGMEEDAKSLARQEELLHDTVPELVNQLGAMEQEARTLQQRAENYDSVDHESLNSARAQLGSADLDVAQKMILLGQLQQQMTDKMEALSAADELKAEFEGQIAEAERVQDECRGWKAEDVKTLKEIVTSIEKKTGWTLVTAEHEVEEGDVDFGPALTMRYRDALRLFFYPAAFQPSPSEQDGRRKSRRSKSDSGPSAPVSLTYTPAEAGLAASADLTTQQRFFLQLLQGHSHALAVLPRGSVAPKTLLSLVSVGWDTAVKVSEEIRLLEIAGITSVSILSDEKLGAKCMLILPDKSRVDVQFTLTANATNEGSISTTVTVEAMPRYGSITTLLTGVKASKVREALNKQASSRALGEGAWVSAIRGLEDWVSLQKEPKEPKKAQEAAKKPAPKPTPAALSVPAAPQVETPTPAPIGPKKELKKPVPLEEVMEEAAARQEELRRQGEEEEEEEQILMSATKRRRPGALRRSP